MSMPSPQSLDFKIVILGEKGVGKTCIVLRYTEGTFSESTNSTIGAFFLTKRISVGGITARMQVWDTAGQERFKAMAPMYYRGAAAALLVFDVTDAGTFAVMQDWVRELKTNVPDGIVLGIAANKSDMPEHTHAVSEADMRAYAAREDAQLFRTSAKADVGIQEAFTALASKVVERMQSGESVSRPMGDRQDAPHRVGRPHASSGSDKKCC